MGFAERFNRYYTDPAWKPSRTVYVSPNGNGNGATRETPMSVHGGGRGGAARHADLLHCAATTRPASSSPRRTAAPTTSRSSLYAERNEDKSLGVVDDLLQQRAADLLQLRGRRLRRASTASS